MATSGNNLKPLVMRSPGKINLFLNVSGRRSDGYHNIETVFQFLDFPDILKFEVTRDHHILRVDTHEYSLPENDLTVRAATLLREKFGNSQSGGVKITLAKSIPPGSGMGGGSSNAAITLIALNRLWRLGLSRQDLLPLAAELGADVPVFVYGKSCWATGIGDVFESFEPRQFWYVLCFPRVEVSTARVFSNFQFQNSQPAISKATFLQGNTANDLEPITRILYPEVDEALTILEEFGDARMNGSGSSVFLRCESKGEANQVQQSLPSYLAAKVVRALNDITEY
jgi:4-diphosphocytidyl-2-C-methyl-D-erythritol kinase